MSALDIGIVAVLGLALLTGWWRGLLRPVITWAFVIAGVVVGFGHPAIASRLAPSAAWRPFMGLVVVAVFALAGMLAAGFVGRLIHRHLRILGALDRVAGAAVSVALALAAVFILLSGLVTMAPTGGLRTQMKESRVAPVIFGVGQRIPFVGDGQAWPGGG